ncbi:MAG: hypothetical protein LBU70_05305 [Chitinispirillales bacterium]|nr:hypothetical protein [Chitinispirillales bacterium]
MTITAIDDICQNYKKLIGHIVACRGRNLSEQAAEATGAFLAGIGWDNAKAIVIGLCRMKTIPQNVLGELERLWEDRKRSMVTTRNYSGHRQAEDTLPEERTVVCPLCKGPSLLNFMLGSVGRIWVLWDCKALNGQGGYGCSGGRIGSQYSRDAAATVIQQQTLYEGSNQSENKQLI